MTTRVAAIQMVSTPDVAENIATARRLVGEAADRGAQLVLLPEYWPLLGQQDTDKLHIAEAFGHGPIQHAMQALAQQHALWLVGGTLPLQSNTADKVFNSTLVYNPQGDTVARYDKMHLFGFDNGVECYDEARTLEHGSAPVTFDSPLGRTGLSVCYDLRFPELYRAMGHCALLLVPAAFTHTTGQAHWDILLRARAIENQCYVLAAAQGGLHRNGRRTWGHSMLIDPWGEVIACLPSGEGVVSGNIDNARLQHVRQQLPALTHRRL